MSLFSKLTALDQGAFGPAGAERAMPRRQAIFCALVLAATGIGIGALGLLSGYMSTPLAVVSVVPGLALGSVLLRKRHW